MKNHIYPCLWFNGNAREAAKFYCSVFDDAVITDDTPLVVNFEASGQKFMCLNGGPEFTFNSSISFFVICRSEEEINRTWDRLLEGGSVLMPLDKYDWSQRYGWLQDRFGLNWQLSFGTIEETGQEVQCGWLKDQFGVSWQIVPTILDALMSDPARSERVVEAFLKMKKFDIEKLLKA